MSRCPPMIHWYWPSRGAFHPIDAGTTRTLLAPHTFHGQLYALAVTGLLRSSLMCGGESQEKAGYLANQLPC
jgi:hypothetical protein